MTMTTRHEPPQPPRAHAETGALRPSGGLKCGPIGPPATACTAARRPAGQLGGVPPVLRRRLGRFDGRRIADTTGRVLVVGAAVAASTWAISRGLGWETTYQPITAGGTVYPAGIRTRDYIHQGSDNVLHASNDLELAPDLFDQEVSDATRGA